MQFRSITAKLTFWSGACLILTSGSIVAYSFVKQRSAAMEVAQQGVRVRIEGLGKELAAEVATVLQTTRVLSNMLAAVKDESVDIELRRENVNGVLRCGRSL